MTTDNRTNEPTEAQVEAAAKAIYEVRPNGDIEWDSAEFDEWMERGDYRAKARAALVAAQDAARPVNSFDTTAERVKTGADSLHVAPQEPSRLPDFFAPKPMPNSYDSAPVLLPENTPREEQIQIFDQIDMPEYNPSANSGRGDWGLRNVSDGTVMTHPTDIVRCVEHGAMNSVSPNRAIWRCLMCGRSAYRDIAGDAALEAAARAAQGAAPQAECDCGAGPGSAVCKKVCATRAPVQPSSGVDEDAEALRAYRSRQKIEATSYRDWKREHRGYGLAEILTWAREAQDNIRFSTGWISHENYRYAVVPQNLIEVIERAMLCRDCCMVRCDAYPGTCRGENYYDQGGTMRNKKIREIAEAEGVSCADCIHEALMTIGHWDFDLDYRVPADLKQKFIETLHHYDMTEH